MNLRSYSGPLSISPNSPRLNNPAIRATFYNASSAQIEDLNFSDGSFSEHGMVSTLLRIATILQEWFHLLLIGSYGHFSSSSDIDFTQCCITTISGPYFPIYLFWVNGSRLESIQSSIDIIDPPLSPFPFTRLATMAPEGNTSLYLYHQINETVIAEDQYDTANGHWISTNITFKTS